MTTKHISELVDGVLATLPKNHLQEHRLSGNFNPDSYEFVESFDYSDSGHRDDQTGLYCSDIIEPMSCEAIQKLNESDYSLDHCTHCGASLVRGNVWHHKPTGEFIIMGNTCSERTQFSKSDFDTYMSQHKLDLAKSLARFKGNYKYKVIRPLLEANIDLVFKGEYVVRNIVSKMVRRRKLPSHKQIRFIRNIPLWNKQAEERQKAREVAKANVIATMTPWVEERQTVTGKVVSFKEVVTDFGECTKVVIELKDGKRCYGTAPRKRLSYDADKATYAKWRYDVGDTISFNAGITVSNKDKSFAFFSRPSLVKIFRDDVI